MDKYEAGAFDEDAEAAGTTLTARFENVPDSHDGSTPFTFELHFSGLCCKPAVGVSQIRTTTVLSSCFCAGQTVP